MPSPIETKSILHRLNLESDDIGQPVSIAADSDYEPYIKGLIDEFHTPSRFKSYKFASETSEVALLVKGICNTNLNDRAQIIANRLHRTEKAAQEIIGHMTSLRPGSLVQILTEINGQQALIFTKVDHSEYLDENELKNRQGLPHHRRVQKSTIILFEDADTIADIQVSDTNNKISRYWWKDFFELEELQTSEQSTNKSRIALGDKSM